MCVARYGTAALPSAAPASPVAASSKKPTCEYTLNTSEKQRQLYDALKGTPRLPELDEPKHCKTYVEVTSEEVLWPIIESHQVMIVAGGFFGDEGKGKTVDAIAKHPGVKAIARTNSGENAGHTVTDEAGHKFVFHLCPSGLLEEGKKNYVGPECVMDPVSFMDKEMKQLQDRGVSYKDKLFVGNVHIVTPYHKLLDMLTSPPNSSTLKGMSPSHASKVTKRGIRLDHIFNDVEVMRSRFKKDLETYFGALKVRNLTDEDVVKRCKLENADGVERIPPYVMNFASAEDKVEYLVNLYTEKVRNNPAFPTRCDVPHELRTVLAAGGKILLEGPQSFWLSNAREKFWESSTSADTSAAGLIATSQFNFQMYKSVVINVHKTPGSSKVGNGANPSSFVPQDYFSLRDIRTLSDLPPTMCTDFNAIQHAFFSAIRPNGVIEPIEYTDSTGTYNVGVAMAIASSRHHGETGATTMKPRVCGLFDCVLSFEVNAVQGPYMTISALDRGDDYDKLGVTIAYVFYDPKGRTFNCNGRLYKNGSIIRAGDPVPSEAALYYCHPIVKLINGWHDTPIAATKRKAGTPLPAGVCEFISTVEHFSKAKILSIGNGPKGSNLIYLKQ